MKYFPIILIAVAGLFPQKLTAQSNDTVCSLFSKAQIEEKLKCLSSTLSLPVFLHWHMSGFCGYPTFYSKISYICPICGGETLYGSDSYAIRKEEFVQSRMGYFEPKSFNYETYAIVYRFDLFRKEVQKIKGINIFLDESEFCKHCSSCSPYTTNPSLNLLVNINGESDTTKTPNVTYIDIQLLRDFLNGNLANKGYRDGSYGDGYIERIKELLGIKD